MIFWKDTQSADSQSFEFLLGLMAQRFMEDIPSKGPPTHTPTGAIQITSLRNVIWDA